MIAAEHLPPINATLNGLSTILLITGYVFARRKQYRAHATLMISAFVVSTLFLIGYISHKYLSGDKSSGLESGALKYFYLLVILAPHVILSMVMVPMIVITLLLAYRRKWNWHRRLARPTLWIWLYVSITGVIIYWMLYHLFPSIH